MNRKRSGIHPRLQIPVLVKHSSDIKKTEFSSQDLVVPSNENRSQTSLHSLSSIAHQQSQNRSKTSLYKTVLPSMNDSSRSSKSENIKNRYESLKTQHLSEFDPLIDEYFGIATNMPFSQGIETFFNQRFHGTACLWQDINSLQTMYSKTFRKTCKRDNGIPGASFLTRKICRVANAKDHKSYDPSVDGMLAGEDAAVLCFPLWSFKNSVVGVVEIARKEEFNEIDEAFVYYFTQKFKCVSKWVLQPQKQDHILYDIMQILSLEQFATVFKSRICQLFQCRMCEIWSHHKESGEILRVSDSISRVDPTKGGIAVDALFNAKTLNCQLNKLHQYYNADIDGQLDEAVLVVPVVQSHLGVNYAIVLRGPNQAQIFSQEDEETLKMIAPYISLAMANSTTHTEFYNEFQKTRFQHEGLAALLEVAEVLSSQLNLEKLNKTIMEKGRSLTNADRCSLFLVNDSGDRLISAFQRGLSTAIDIPISSGCAGLAVKESRIVNISNAYDDPSFDKSTDERTGYHTTTLLCVPIYNNKGEVIGVTEMVNKLDQKPFSQWDAKVIQIFNVFCGISIENARLYKESTDLSQQLQSFFDVTISLSKKEDVEKILGCIIRNACNVVNADRASVFVFDPIIKCLKKYIADDESIPETLPMDKGIAAACVESKKPLIVNDAYHDPRFNRTVDSETGYKTSSVIVVPITSTSGEVVGVSELINKKDGMLFTDSDVKILQSFATFASMAFEKSKLQEIANYGSTEVEMMKWIGESEKDRCDKIPELLQLPEEKQEAIKGLNFMTRDLEPMERIKLLFFEFYDFGLPQEFNITNEMLFKFIWEIHLTYHDVPYHNWIHAVDVTQYVSYEVRIAEMKNKYSKFELLALLVAAVCHDAGHDGFNNIYNVKAETPLGILFKDQSVMETYHCTVAINVLARDECNLFHAISEQDQKKIWGIIIKLILATDMAFHFKLVKQASEMCDAGPFDITDPDQRILGLQLILKVADISNVSRPFKLADKWCDVLSEEFFRQGDHEKQSFGLTSPLNDRENPDKPKSQIGFYNFVCIPLYSVISRMFPQLEVNLNSVKSNLEVWKSFSAPQQKQ